MAYTTLFATLILLTCFVLMGNRKAGSYIRTFRIQSLLIALSALILGIEDFQKNGGISILAVCLLVVILKVFYIPRLLLKTFDNVKREIDKDYVLNIPMLELLSCGVFVFIYNLMKTSGISGSSEFTTLLVNSISVILIGFLFMISRKKAVGQIIGFLVIENGLFITAMYSAHGMPMILEVGIFIDVLSAVLIMGMLVYKIHEKFKSTDINKLTNLRG